MADQTPPTINHDGNWKKIIKALFPDFVAFFLPILYEDIDWTNAPVYLDKDLDKLLPKNNTKEDQEGDLLVQITLNNQGKAKLLAHQKKKKKYKKKKTDQEQAIVDKTLWLLIHIEVQSYYDGKFDERMFTYYYRIWDQQHKPTTALAIFTTPYLMPTTYQQSLYGTSVDYQYNTYWLKDQDEEKLLASDNVFALVVLAALYALKTKNKEAQRFRFKKKLLNLLIKSGHSADKRVAIFHFLKNILALSPPTELQFETKIDHIVKTQTKYNSTQRERDFADRLYAAIHGTTIEEVIEREAKKRSVKALLQLQQEMEAKRKEEEVKRKKAERRQKEEEAKRKEEEAKRKEEEAKRKEEETKRKEEETKRKEEEIKRKEEETKRKEEETKRKEEEAKHKKEVENLLQEKEKLQIALVLSLYHKHQLPIPEIATMLKQEEEVIQRIINANSSNTIDDCID